VGDNISKDIIPAKLNNIQAVYIHRGGKYDTQKMVESVSENLKPDYEISNLDDLFNIVDELNKKFYLGKII
jgi:FMN phosphatase YigB (HAD superfamily)